MVIEIELPDGSIAEFPDGMQQEQIEKVLQNQFPRKNIGEKTLEVLADLGSVTKKPLQDFGAGAIEAIGGRLVGLSQLKNAAEREIVESIGLDTSYYDKIDKANTYMAGKFDELGKGTGVAGLAGNIVADPLNLLTAGMPVAKGANVATRIAKNTLAGGAMGLAEGATNPLSEGESRSDNMALSTLMGAAVPTAMDIAKLSPVTWALTQAKDALTPVSDDVAKSNAAKRLVEVSPNFVDNMANRDTGTFINPTLTQSLDDSGVAGLQSVAEKQGQFRSLLEERNLVNQEALKRASDLTVGAGDITQTQEFAKQGIDMLQGRTQRLADSSSQSINALNPSVSIADAGIAARAKIEANKNAYIENVRKPAWEAVPREVVVKANNTLKTLKELNESIGVAKQDLIPVAKVQEVLSLNSEKQVPSMILDSSGNNILKTKQRGNLNIGQMQDLRSVLLEDAARARGAGENLKASINEKLADAVLDDMGARAGALQGEAGKALRYALDATKYEKQTFGSGEIGDVLGVERDRVASVADELTLEKLLGDGRVKGSVGLDRLLKAAPEAKAEAEQYLLNKFNQKAINVNDGTLKINQALRFVRDNEDIFRTMPEIKERIVNAVSASKRYNVAADRQYALFDALNIKETQRVFGAKKVDLASDFLQGDANDAIKSLLKNKSPDAIRDVMRYAKKDPTGGAVIGLRAAAANYVLSSGSGSGMSKVLSDTKQRALLQEIMPPAHMKRIEQIARDFEIMERSTQSANIGDVLAKPNTILQKVARIAGLKATGALNVFSGSGSMAQSAIFSGSVGKIIDNLTSKKTNDVLMEAIMNPDLAQALSMRIDSKESQKKFMSLMQKVAATNAGKILLSDKKQEPFDDKAYQEIIITPQSNFFEAHDPAPAVDTSYTRENEGARGGVYQDTTGNATVGIGFNFNSGIAPKVWRSAGLSPKLYNQVKRGEATITPEQQNALYQKSFEIADNDARAYYENFDELSAQQQTALRDMSYQMGINNLREFTGLKKALKNQDGNAIVKSLIRSKYYKQTPERAIKNARLLLNRGE